MEISTIAFSTMVLLNTGWELRRRSVGDRIFKNYSRFSWYRFILNIHPSLALVVFLTFFYLPLFHVLFICLVFLIYFNLFLFALLRVLVFFFFLFFLYILFFLFVLLFFLFSFSYSYWSSSSSSSSSSSCSSCSSCFSCFCSGIWTTSDYNYLILKNKF